MIRKLTNRQTQFVWAHVYSAFRAQGIKRDPTQDDFDRVAHQMFGTPRVRLTLIQGGLK